MAGWKIDPKWVDVFPVKNWDIPASYVSLPKGKLDWKVADGLQTSVFVRMDSEALNFTL